MNMRCKSVKSSKGMTLIEIMIALVIGSLLMVGAMGLFISNKRIYKEQDDMGRLQENARFAMDILLRDIRMSGYVGCSNDASTVNNTLTFDNGGTPALVTTQPENLLNYTNPIEGSENAANWLPDDTAPSNSTEVVASMVAGTDGITLRYFAALDSTVAMNGTTDGAIGTTIPVTCTPDCASNVTLAENMVISDCASSDIFDVTTVNVGSLAHANSALSKSYPSTAQISRYVANRYYIGTGANGRPALFRYTYAQDINDLNTNGSTVDFVAQSQELIEGVQSMQILYGEDTTATPDFIADIYRNAAAVADWSDVVSVRIALLLETVEENFHGDIDSNTYNLLGTVVPAANDYRRRRVYTTTVQVRSRSG